MSATTDGRSTRWAQHRLDRREELVEATLRAIRQHGASVGMDDIAAAAGTSKTVFYRYFTDRAGLYHAVSERVDALILHDLGRAVGAADVPLADVVARPRELIAAAIDSYLVLVERDPEVYRFVVTAPLLDRSSDRASDHDSEPVVDPAARMSGHVAQQMTEVLSAALASAGQDTAPAPVWTHGIVGMVRAAADAWLAGGPGFAGMPRTDLTASLTDLAWTGLAAAWPGSA